MTWLLVAVGAAVGAPLRYLTDRAVQARREAVFPWGTFVVNAGASLVLGVLTGALVSSATYALLGTGLCGALSTYSTFSYETLRLAERGRTLLAAANVGASLLVGLGAVVAGSGIGRALAG
ncbi:CrcB protein [Streptomyces agglomeratus]|uniref:fluoride efflux transporter FluC n=1 Tax=Streptomyces agglomeratus TaxID=285458 RepID=UPI000854E2C2|nr:CrcB family protein [Streptomyces agglomeratus]OEJ39745.1 CrcB protein [Streptomyces agglomeratus]OEJ45872.1 CrcB protein [Streptomyces agglomeratus]OEJ59666.1 CrcB protein [Streptomyces agglomeratus]